MSKVIYKYPIDGFKWVVRLPYRSEVLSIDMDPNLVLSMWAVHDPDDEQGREVEYEVLVVPTGMPTDEPLSVLGEHPIDGFAFFKTVVANRFVWHVFLRKNLNKDN